jgi:CheY-like chemotaxis protein
MDKGIAEKIFDPFFTTKELGKGTGMGLSVVHGIVKNMNGAIQVKSELGYGSKFSIYLPVIAKSIQEPKQKDNEIVPRGDGQILLVDDEEEITEMGRQMLERHGYKVSAHTDSIEALKIFKTCPDNFDIVITDMAMPNMSGDELAKKISTLKPDIPIILCTGYSETMSEEKALSIGIKTFLAKPVIMKELVAKIRELLNND